MARHIMAVCVVCLLCANRFHCQDHVEDVLVSAQSFNGKLNARVYSAASVGHNPSPSSETTERKQLDDDAPNYSTSPPYRRRKRHASPAHEHQPSMPEITQFFLQQLITQHAMNINDTEAELTDTATATHMNAFAFQRLLEQLGLQVLVSGNLSGNTCVAETRLVHHVQPHDLSHHDQHDHLQHGQEGPLGQRELNNTLFTNDSLVNATFAGLVEAGGAEHANYTLSNQDLLHLCPVLLYQLAAPSAAQRAGCIRPDVLAEIDNVEVHHHQSHENDMTLVWIYAFISVTACGILGLLGVAIIPCMGSYYYKHVIQYLVSLAVGTMTGDALLHLLPHSLAGQDERGMILKGLACLSGIIFFYVTEHALTMISEWRKSVEKKETKKPSRAKVMRDPDSSVNNSVAGDKMCKQKYSSYPYCYDEITTDNKQDVWMHSPGDNAVDAADPAAPSSGTTGSTTTGGIATPECSNLRNGKAEHDGSSESAAAAQSLLSTSHNNYAEMNHRNHNHNNHQQQDAMRPAAALDSNTISNDPDDITVSKQYNSKDNSNLKEDKNDHVMVILREHESSHHGHSHRHGHVHSPPETLSAVAWMIIMGDGLHNFTDGMAIGAAFAENIAGGFSTSLAVFCHELPHELGDFAILMKAGMSVKSAVYYNMLTGVLSFIGMTFGIVFGQSQEMAQWMFAVAAGLFIYIALVDMMPEISAAHKSLAQFLLQILGMLSGVVIMLLIAFYEGDLMNVFDKNKPPGVHHQHVH